MGNFSKRVGDPPTRDMWEGLGGFGRGFGKKISETALADNVGQETRCIRRDHAVTLANAESDRRVTDHPQA